MSRAIRRKEDYVSGLIRVAAESLDEAVALLSSDGDRALAIHRARRLLKQVRAILWVLEVAVGQPARDMRKSLAGTARRLAGARDADVMLATAEAAGFDDWTADLGRQAVQAHAVKTPIKDVCAELTRMRDRLEDLTVKGDGRKVLGKALRKAYHQGRKSKRTAGASRATADLHAWRKRVKRLLYIAEVADRKLHPSAARLRRRLDDLGELLGVDHDHALLADKARREAPGRKTTDRRCKKISRRRRALQDQAFKLGEKIYSESPKDFARRFALSKTGRVS